MPPSTSKVKSYSPPIISSDAPSHKPIIQLGAAFQGLSMFTKQNILF